MQVNRQVDAAELFIGWDVGGWDCDRNPRSRDALVVMDASRKLVGEPWRGNLRKTINEATDGGDFVQRLLDLCEVGDHSESSALLAIDAPLAFSREFVSLTSGGEVPATIYRNDCNPYLFRETERFLIAHGHRPLSPVKDMIGSQATKARHVISRFAPELQETGIWSDGKQLSIIEGYPSVARKSPYMDGIRQAFLQGVNADGQLVWICGIKHGDQVDALSCALIAWLLANEPSKLSWPGKNIPREEGWIWVPADALGEERALLLESG